MEEIMILIEYHGQHTLSFSLDLSVGMRGDPQRDNGRQSGGNPDIQTPVLMGEYRYPTPFSIPFPRRPYRPSYG